MTRWAGHSLFEVSLEGVEVSRPEPRRRRRGCDTGPVKLRRLLGRGDRAEEVAGDDDATDEIADDDAGEVVAEDDDRDGADRNIEIEGDSADEDDSTDSADAEDASHDDEDSDHDDADPTDVGPDDDAGAEDPVTDADATDGDSDDDEQGSGYIEFELAEWGTRERKLLDGELAAVRVRRAWEASTLVVAASDADVVDDLIDLIEERIALDLSPDVEPVVYEVGDWPQGLEDRFIEALITGRVAHMRGYREITVGVDDEERVDGIVEDVTKAWQDEQVADDELGGPDAQDVLSELFVSADRLMHDASDKAATVRFDDAADTATTMSVPFGFIDADWEAITDRVSGLRELLGEADSTDDEIIEAATALRSHLRPLV